MFFKIFILILFSYLLFSNAEAKSGVLSEVTGLRAKRYGSFSNCQQIPGRRKRYGVYTIPYGGCAIIGGRGGGAAGSSSEGK
uniref:Uncharacterized protein n=1 Tax=Acrobeloides nanus TaxID=290746 RepID=A0A914D2H3_9BILA